MFSGTRTQCWVRVPEKFFGYPTTRDTRPSPNREGGEGVKNPGKFAYVLYGWPLIELYEIWNYMKHDKFTFLFQSITLQDSQPASFMDLGSQFYLTENDVKQGKNRFATICWNLNIFTVVVCFLAFIEKLHDRCRCESEHVSQSECV